MNSVTKILSITTDPNAGGSSKSLLNLIVELKKEGFDISVVVPKKGYLSNELINSNINVFYDPYLRLSTWPQLRTRRDILLFFPRFIRDRIYSLFSSFIINKIIKKYNPTIIHSNVSLISVGERFARKKNILHIWHIREFGMLDFCMKQYPSLKRFKNRIAQNWSITVSKALADYYGLGENNQIIYNGIRHQQNIEEKKKQQYYLYVGALTTEKGIDDLIEAFHIYRKNGGRMNLKLIGTGKEKYLNKVIDTIAIYNLSSTVELVGQVENVDKYMQYAKCIIIPSHYEAFGRVTAEAMFNKCLVIGRDTGGTKEQLDYGEYITGDIIGYRFNNVNELVECMVKVESIQDEEYTQITSRAAEFANKHYTIENNTIETLKFIRHIQDSDKN